MTIDSIPGASKINTITIRGNGNKIISNLSSIVQFNNASYINIDSLQIIGGIGFTGIAIHLGNQSKHINISNCNIEAGTTSTSSFNAAIVASGSINSATVNGNNANNITIEKNLISGGYYGIIMNGENSYLNNFGPGDFSVFPIKLDTSINLIGQYGLQTLPIM